MNLVCLSRNRLQYNHRIDIVNSARILITCDHPTAGADLLYFEPDHKLYKQGYWLYWIPYLCKLCRRLIYVQSSEQKPRKGHQQNTVKCGPSGLRYLKSYRFASRSVCCSTGIHTSIITITCNKTHQILRDIRTKNTRGCTSASLRLMETHGLIPHCRTVVVVINHNLIS